MDNLIEKDLLKTEIEVDKQFFLDLLDFDKQTNIEKERFNQTIESIFLVYLNKINKDINENLEKITAIENGESFAANDYINVLKLKEKNNFLYEELKKYEKFLIEPYFARMDLGDALNKYFRLYIGKKGDIKLGIVDWRAPLAKRYYQKSSLKFSFNEFNYKVILRRAFKIKDKQLLDWKNEYLNLKDYLSKEELTGSDESIVFDPFLKEILYRRKDEDKITDIIETIQEKQYEIITEADRQNLIVQGVAGSGKTMVLLHRLSYLMYNDQNIKPENILLLTPSDSFNDFIDELCTILEIEKVKTHTIENYFDMLLKEKGIDISKKIDFNIQEDASYLKHIYSKKFAEGVKISINKIYNSFIDFLTCKEFLSLKKTLLEEYIIADKEYKKLKNAKKYIIRAALGEIKISDKEDIYYTKQLRRLMSEFSVVNDFLNTDFDSLKMQNYYQFFTLYKDFFESVKFISKNYETAARDSLDSILLAEKEVIAEATNLKKYQIFRPGEAKTIFSEKIDSLDNKLQDFRDAEDSIRKICMSFDGIIDLITALKSSDLFIHSGNADKNLGIARFLYNEIIKKVKIRYKVSLKKLYPSDLYILTMLLNYFMVPLKLGHSYIFIDEGQDLSSNEFELIRNINDTSAINVFGDYEQNISFYRGIDSWTKEDCHIDGKMYELIQNYRNTNEIVKFVSEKLSIDMQAIGVHGEDVKYLAEKDVERQVLSGIGLKAIIADNNKISEIALSKQKNNKYNIVKNTKKIHRGKINLLTVTESKGLEFSVVACYDKNMSKNEKYIAYTRALKELYIFE